MFMCRYSYKIRSRLQIVVIPEPDRNVGDISEDRVACSVTKIVSYKNGFSTFSLPMVDVGVGP